PGSVPEVEKRFGEALTERVKVSPLGAFFHTEVGPLNRIIHIWPYDDLQHRTRVRSQSIHNWPPKIQEFIVEMESKIVNAAPFWPLRQRRDPHPPRCARHPHPHPRERGDRARRARWVRVPHHLGPKSRKKLSKNPPPGCGGAAATTPTDGDGAPGSGRTGIAWVAASMKRRQVCAGNEPPVTLFIGALSSLPSQTPATKSAV